MAITRFCPSTLSGHCTIGHALTFYVNLLHAKATGGQFYYVADACVLRDDDSQLPSYMYRIPHSDDMNELNMPALDTHVSNVSFVAESLAPGISRHTIHMLGVAPLVTAMMKQQGIDFPSHISRSVILLAAIDYIIGTDVVIRGRDFDIDSKWFEPVFAEYVLTHKILLDKWVDKPIDLWYAPLMLDESGSKISKTDTLNTHTITYLLNNGILPLSLLAYAYDIISEQGYSNLAELAACDVQRRSHATH